MTTNQNSNSPLIITYGLSEEMVEGFRFIGDYFEIDLETSLERPFHAFYSLIFPTGIYAVEDVLMPELIQRAKNYNDETFMDDYRITRRISDKTGLENVLNSLGTSPEFALYLLNYFYLEQFSRAYEDNPEFICIDPNRLERLKEAMSSGDRDLVDLLQCPKIQFPMIKPYANTNKGVSNRD